MLTHQWVAALLVGAGVALGRDDDGVLVHQLAGRVGEGRQRQVDPLHLALVRPLLALLLHVPAPGDPDTATGLLLQASCFRAAGVAGPALSPCRATTQTPKTKIIHPTCCEYTQNIVQDIILERSKAFKC